jgi:hypothetical protein
MSSSGLDQLPMDLITVLRRELLRLARLEEELAAREAAQVPYWTPLPPAVDGHRAAARALRDDADGLMSGAGCVAATATSHVHNRRVGTS